jgi:hypothetical protein
MGSVNSFLGKESRFRAILDMGLLGVNRGFASTPLPVPWLGTPPDCAQNPSRRSSAPGVTAKYNWKGGLRAQPDESMHLGFEGGWISRSDRFGRLSGRPFSLVIRLRDQDRRRKGEGLQAAADPNGIIRN